MVAPDPTADEAVIVSDHDVLLDRGRLEDLLRLSVQARVVLAQPAHSARSC